MRLNLSIATPAGAPVEIRFDGHALTALPGETVAAALAAHGLTTVRTTRSGARRGVYCGMGACFDCLVTIDGRVGVRACLAKVEAGMVIESTSPSLADATALAAVPTLATPELRRCDVLVIGAGPAGLSAALAAAQRGATVIVLDERPAAGGQYFKPLAPSLQFSNDAAADAQFRAGRALVDAVTRAGVHIASSATAWGAFAADEIAALVDDAAVLYRPKRLILAPGAYERPVPIPGWTLPGVMTTGALQTLARAYRVSPGERVLIAGNGPLNLQLAVELARGGVPVVGIVETAPRPSVASLVDAIALWRAGSDLAREGLGYLIELRRRGVPIYWNAGVTRVEGTDRFETAVVVSRGRELRIAADVLTLGYGFIPSTELARQLGCAMRFVDRHIGYSVVETAANGLTSIPNVYAIGDGADIGGARVALARGTLAGLAVVASLGLGHDVRAERLAGADLARAERFQKALWSLFSAPTFDVTAIDDTTIVCRCEEVTAGAVRAVMQQGAASLGAIKRQTRCGMGRCQGRYCQGTLARMVAAKTRATPDAYSYFAPRPPAKPIPIAAIAFEQPEWGGHREVKPPPVIRTAPSVPFASRELHADVVVIGGGVAGTACAYYLAGEGIDTLVLERDEVNLQASGGNAGSLHVQLLSFDFGAKAQAGGGPAAHTLPLGSESVRLWQAIERDAGANLEIRTVGGLMVADTPEQMRFLEAKIALERTYGIEAMLLGPRELRDLAPALADNLVGAELCPAEGKINPLTATYVLAAQAAKRGARFEVGTEVRAIERNRADWLITTSRGPVRAGRIVNAAGPWSPVVSRLVGIERLPVQGAPLQMIVTEPAPKAIDHLVAHADRHLSLKQADAGGFVIGGGWSAGVHPETGFSRVLRTSLEGNLWVAQHVLPLLSHTRVVRAWAATNINIDGAPILGEAPGVPGFYHCVTSNGYTLAPIVGRITAELVRNGRSSIAIERYSLARFQ